MNVSFGLVNMYNIDKGFGFLTNPISLGPNRDVFFHISKVNSSRPDIASRLLEYEKGDNIYFWYTTKITIKGAQLEKILTPLDAQQYVKNYGIDIKDNLESIWKNIDASTPPWLMDATIGFIGAAECDKLLIERTYLIQKRKEKEEEEVREIKRLLEIEKLNKKTEQENREKERIRIEEKYAIEKMLAEEESKRKQEIKKEQQINESSEFELLVKEIEALGFTKSTEVSKYIVKKKLGIKYQHISGYLEMSNKGRTWEFKGGFPTHIYRRLCERLNLENNNSNSTVIGFKSFAELNIKLKP